MSEYLYCTRHLADIRSANGLPPPSTQPALPQSWRARQRQWLRRHPRLHAAICAGMTMLSALLVMWPTPFVDADQTNWRVPDTASGIRTFGLMGAAAFGYATFRLVAFEARQRRRASSRPD